MFVTFVDIHDILHHRILKVQWDTKPQRTEHSVNLTILLVDMTYVYYKAEHNNLTKKIKLMLFNYSYHIHIAKGNSEIICSSKILSYKSGSGNMWQSI